MFHSYKVKIKLSIEDFTRKVYIAAESKKSAKKQARKIGKRILMDLGFERNPDVLIGKDAFGRDWQPSIDEYGDVCILKVKVQKVN